MELQEAMRTMGTCRYYTSDPVPDDVLERVLDAARYAPQGGNRQPVRFVVVRDEATKRQLKEWYLVPWKAYVGGTKTGDIKIGTEKAARVVSDADYFAEHMDEVPVLLVACGVLEDIHPTDTELDRFGIVGGGSIYPAVQNLLLTAREEGLGGTLTTLLCIYEQQVKELLNIPEGVGTAAVIALGWPAKPFPTKLSRKPLSNMVYDGAWGTPMFEGAPA